jgi:hypothetical protein
MSKYEPLEKFLKSLEARAWRVEFQEVEKLLGFALPMSAFKYPAWWSNDDTGHSHARSWLDAGWRTEQLDVAGQRVTFVRSNAETQTSASKKRDPWGCMAGTVKVMPGVDLTTPSNEGWNAEKGLLLNE